MTLGKRLKELRNKKNLTQLELSSRLGIARVTYTNYEADRKVPEYATLQKLGEILDASIDYLMNGEEEDQEKEVEKAIGRIPVEEFIQKYRGTLTFEDKDMSDEQIASFYSFMKALNKLKGR